VTLLLYKVTILPREDNTNLTKKTLKTEKSMYIAIITDFGYKDPYVGIMQSVMLQAQPDLRFIDLTQDIAPFDIRSASYVLASAWPYLPPGTVVLLVVDPGVGGIRRELIAARDGKSIVAPDNGAVSLLEHTTGSLSCYRAGAELLEELEALRPGFARTFDGRDLFSPLAGRIASQGLDAVAGEQIEPLQLDNLVAQHREGPRGPVLEGHVVHRDHFGNVVTTITAADLAAFRGDSDARSLTAHLRAGDDRHMVRAGLGRTFSDVEPGQPLAYLGSAGFLELALREGDFTKTHQVQQNDIVELIRD